MNTLSGNGATNIGSYFCEKRKAGDDTVKWTIYLGITSGLLLIPATNRIIDNCHPLQGDTGGRQHPG